MTYSDYSGFGNQSDFLNNYLSSRKEPLEATSLESTDTNTPLAADEWGGYDEELLGSYDWTEDNIQDYDTRDLLAFGNTPCLNMDKFKAITNRIEAAMVGNDPNNLPIVDPRLGHGGSDWTSPCGRQFLDPNPPAPETEVPPTMPQQQPEELQQLPDQGNQ